MTTTQLPWGPAISAHPAHDAQTSPTSLRRAALRDVAAMSPGVVPFGLVLGVTAADAGSSVAALVGAFTVYGGSAQLTTLTVLHLGATLLGAVLAGAVVNARVLLYGASLEPWFRDQPLWFRLVAPHFILDQTYLATVERPQLRGAAFRRYWAWLGGALLVVWEGAVAIGVLIGPVLPPLPHLLLVGTALFVSMLVPRLTNRPAVVAATTAGLTAFAVARVVPELGIVAGAVAGVVLAEVYSRRCRR